MDLIIDLLIFFNIKKIIWSAVVALLIFQTSENPGLSIFSENLNLHKFEFFVSEIFDFWKNRFSLYIGFSRNFEITDFSRPANANGTWCRCADLIYENCGYLETDFSADVTSVWWVKIPHFL